MPLPENYVAFPDSDRAILPGARAIGPTDPNVLIEVTVRVRNNPSSRLPSADEIGAQLPNERQYLSREDFDAAYGASDDDLDKVKAFAKEHNLNIVDVSAPRRSVLLSGTAQAFIDAFQVKLIQYENPDYRGRVGPLHVPDELLPIVEGVFGLDNRPQAKPFCVFSEEGAAAIQGISYTPLQVAQFYNFPTGLDGQGQCIGILEFGGGYTEDDLRTYFKQLGIPMPQISSVSVDGAQNQPGDDQASLEVTLDIEIAGAIAPGARIVVYFAPFTEQGWVDALTRAIHDNQNKPSVLSISWGFTEGRYIWTEQAIRAVNQALQAAALIGVTVCCASGDDGSNDQGVDGHAHVDFPASSPYVLACGGTRLDVLDGQISSEVVWYQGPRAPGGGTTGGGISDVNPLPNWQSNAMVPGSVNPGGRIGRGVPDVAGNAYGRTGYSIRLNGRDRSGVGGTSAVAPLWAGLIARINQRLDKPLGYFNPVLYTRLATIVGVFHDITEGSNDTTGHIGGYSARKGWDACTGWGSPDGAKLLEFLMSLPEDTARISELPPLAAKLFQQVSHPDEIDEATKSLQIPASLLNFHLATPIDLSSVGLGQAVHIPVQITGREGGRKSLYYLKAGEETLEGIYVTNQGIALHFVKRVTGDSLPAQSGDTYEQRITSREGEQISWSEGKLEVLDSTRGIGSLSSVIWGVRLTFPHSQILATTPPSVDEPLKYIGNLLGQKGNTSESEYQSEHTSESG